MEQCRVSAMFTHHGRSEPVIYLSLAIIATTPEESNTYTDKISLRHGSCT